MQDNGSGLTASTIEKSLDYMIRVSDKSNYVSPSRGQQGNALKCLWAAPFVVDGERGLVEVFANGVKYTIDVSLDRIAQEPKIKLSREDCNFVKKGTLVKIHWAEIAS